MKNTQNSTTERAGIGSTTLFAFVVGADNTASVIAFAPDQEAAKKLASRSEWLKDCEWIDLRVNREPKLDALAQSRGVGIITGDGPDDARIMRELGWYEIDGSSEYCENCGLHQWECLPESYIAASGDAFLCRECLDALDTEPNEKLTA